MHFKVTLTHIVRKQAITDTCLRFDSSQKAEIDAKNRVTHLNTQPMRQDA